MKADVILLFDDWYESDKKFKKSVKETVDDLGRAYVKYKYFELLVVKDESFLDKKSGEELTARRN